MVQSSGMAPLAMADRGAVVDAAYRDQHPQEMEPFAR